MKNHLFYVWTIMKNGTRWLNIMAQVSRCLYKGRGVLPNVINGRLPVLVPNAVYPQNMSKSEDCSLFLQYPGAHCGI